MANKFLKINIKKYIVFFSITFLLLVALYVSINYEETNIAKLWDKINPINLIIAATKTNQSSTSTTTPSNGADMTQLLARLINRRSAR